MTRKMRFATRLLAGATAALGALAAAPARATSPIDVPPGNELALSLSARGVQVYTCLMATTGEFAWTFKAPEATLFDREGEIVATHSAGPTWESTRDHSKIVGTRIASVASVTAGAIPQLLLSAVVQVPGPTFGKVSYVQRLNTVGGSAPASGCDMAHQGAEVRVPYTATYTFWERD